jgi:hypothetical protein
MLLRANEIFHREENKDPAYSLISIRAKLRLSNLLDCREKRISKFVNGIIFILIGERERRDGNVRGRKGRIP